ncbi:hypothetical protein Tco_1060478, partial [Tanacetum coccineum]
MFIGLYQPPQLQLQHQQQQQQELFHYHLNHNKRADVTSSVKHAMRAPLRARFKDLPTSSKTAASAEYSAWTTTDTRIKPSITTIPDDLYMDDETTTDEQAYSSGDEVGRDHIPTVNLRQSWWKPLTE